MWIVDLDTGEVAGVVRFDGLLQEVFDLQVIVGALDPSHAGLSGGERHVHLLELENELHDDKSFVVPTDALTVPTVV